MKLPVVLVALLSLSACAVAVPSSPDPASSASVPGSSAAATTTCDYPDDGRRPAREVQPPQGTAVAASGTRTATMTLNGQPLALTLDAAAAPCTVNSFLSLAAQGYYDDTECHRLVDTGRLFILQCGDPSASGTGGPGYTVADELEQTRSYPAGVLAMANTGTPDSNGSQFFIVYADSQLQPDYTVFGRTDEAGIALLTEIASQGQDSSYGSSGGGRPHAGARIASISQG